MTRPFACSAKNRAVLLTHFEFPTTHWKYLRTTSPIDLAFATARLRQRITKGAGSRTKALTMAYKLIEMAEACGRKLDATQLLVRADTKFVDGVQLRLPS